ncbi:MAG: ABC transporter permease subunit, partial [Candidatus Hodarchaeota archaeon]
MANTKEYKDFIWTFPLLGGILMIIGLLTPSTTGVGMFSWLWGGNYFEIGGESNFYWTLEIYDDVPLIFISNITLFIILLISAIGSIIYSLMVWKTEDFPRYERKWLYLGIIFIISITVYLIEFEFLMRYYFNEYIGIDASYWEFFDPGFGLIAPFISGSIILIGFGVNRKLPKKRDWYFKTIKLYRNIIISFLIGISIFFIGSVLVFSIFHLLPGDPVIAYLAAQGIYNPSPELIAATRNALGFDDPLIMQYFRFLFDFFTRNWGESISIARGYEVLNLLKERVPITIDLLLIPLILGMGAHIIMGIWLGRTSYKYRRRRVGNIIQILSNIFISIPIFIFGMLLQYFLAIKLDWFPATGYKNPAVTDPKLRTGFFIIDAILAGESGKIWGYLYYMTLPIFVLTLMSIPLI